MTTNFEKYLNTIKETNNQFSTFVDFNKIENNVSKIKCNLKDLDDLICNNELEFSFRLKKLFLKNKKCFEIIPNLIAVRKELNDMKNLSKKDNDLNFIEYFFNNTGLKKFILSGKIKSFVDLYYGIEIGLDSNTRKNRNGKLIEEELNEYIKNFFVNHSEIEIFSQMHINNIEDLSKKFQDINYKKFDFIIRNKNNGKIILLESSFYNTGGSKISETARSYYDLFNKINSYEKEIIFFWVADGRGMKTIKKDLISKFKYNYITNLFLLNEKLSLIF